MSSATGIPTIQDELHRNGSPDATIETDDGRSYFLIEIPCREGFEGLDDTNNTQNDNSDPINDPNEPQNEPQKDDRQKQLVEVLRNEPTRTRLMLAERLSVSLVTIKRDINKLTELGIIRHAGSSKGGRWEIITDKNQ